MMGFLSSNFLYSLRILLHYLILRPLKKKYLAVPRKFSAIRIKFKMSGSNNYRMENK